MMVASSVADLPTPERPLASCPAQCTLGDCRRMASHVRGCIVLALYGFMMACAGSALYGFMMACASRRRQRNWPFTQPAATGTGRPQPAALASCRSSSLRCGAARRRWQTRVASTETHPEAGSYRIGCKSHLQ